jgi:hypothetical protein
VPYGDVVSLTPPLAPPQTSRASIVVRPQISYTTLPGFSSVLGGAQLPSLCVPLFSLETFDTAAGVTHLAIASPAENLPGYPVPPRYPAGAEVLTNIVELPPLGLAPTETLQVNLTLAGTATPSCTGYVDFYDTSGVSIGNAANLTVSAEQTFSASLSYPSTAGFGSRVMVRPDLTFWSFPPPTPCLPLFSLEIVDTASGATHAFLRYEPPNAREPLVYRPLGMASQRQD